MRTMIEKYRRPRTPRELALTIALFMEDHFRIGYAGGINSTGGDLQFDLGRKHTTAHVVVEEWDAPFRRELAASLTEAEARLVHAFRAGKVRWPETAEVSAEEEGQPAIPSTEEQATAFPPPADPTCTLAEFQGDPNPQVFDAPGEKDDDADENQLAIAAMVRTELAEFLRTRPGIDCVEVMIRPDHSAVFTATFDSSKDPAGLGSTHVRIVLEPGWIYR